VGKLIPVEPLQKVYLTVKAKGVTDAELARRCNWYQSGPNGRRNKADGQRVQRVLGLRPRQPHGGIKNNTFTKYVRRETALKLLEAFLMDPSEIGL
jgi:hypothetical protein